MNRQTPDAQDCTAAEALAHKLPYALVVLLGAAVIAVGFGATPRAFVGAGVYVACGGAGALWMILMVCPHCANYGRSCPCGYGLISARLRRKGDTKQFGARFRRYMPAIVPLWIVPVAAGGVALAPGFSWQLVSLLAAFILESFVLLPLVSAKCECARCVQRGACPWAGLRAADEGLGIRPDGRRA